ncbi:hypothetical protein Pmar_PMAR010315 [Perkinsus marinus ATCC 50983]|uniref:Uncharacterized protein n=1 Tax=Perkinsus marinus (strain ATCC 50983 / TXsc) TaxID=423536 RepID=C5K5E5_PERM5|nr:hypothetical protein Pmar_PMAR010315 [Perkinsus marinus ATCC 50983]EER20567.1 hypothetical protein Pmar_PMAR010315 [Perkinsus marinus ATCC 50983]|eukprot:XP_002788771.1 hypothetical protein Pmar_PMAR010315 [Perkinsus marinus ATCC 50983]
MPVTGVLTEEHTFKPEVTALSSPRNWREGDNSESRKSPSAASERSSTGRPIAQDALRRDAEQRAKTGEMAFLRMALQEALGEVERWKGRCEEVTLELRRVKSKLKQREEEVSDPFIRWWSFGDWATRRGRELYMKRGRRPSPCRDVGDDWQKQ